MNGFHIRKKVMADHKSWPLLCKSNEVSESVKTSVNGKTELKTRKRLIFMWSFRNPVAEAITSASGAVFSHSGAIGWRLDGCSGLESLAGC